MNDGKVDWKGNFTAVITPFTQSGEIDERLYRENVERLIGHGVSGIVVAGCTGESWSLKADEKVHLVSLAVDVSNGRVPVVAGTGTISTADVIDVSKRVKDAGAAGILVLPPYYAMPGMREIEMHYEAISDAVQHPIMLYNIPRRTGINMEPEMIARLTELEWVVAIKESSNGFTQLEQLIRLAGDAMHIFAGHSAERGYAAIKVGCKGFVSSLEAQAMPEEAVGLYRLTVEGNDEEAKRVQYRCLELDQFLRSGVGTFPANLKETMRQRGMEAGHVRPPIQPLTSQERDKVSEILQRLDLL
jgi:4-hydroxy-tetrahydrodipicolinate synthase